MDNLANSATFSWKMKTSWCDQEEGSSPIGLNLELGRSSDHKLEYKNRSRFTFLQIQELHLQVLIYKYLEAGLAIPHHLLVPIWQSFSASLGTLKDLGGGALCLDPRRDLDPEPCRCRRTDGKKWRCAKEALPSQKYCGRHMHRGRHRSRKLVDSSRNIAGGRSCSSTNSTCKKSDFGKVDVVGSDTELSISLPRLDR